jgi:uncharacterized protein (TIGR00369 family)
MTDLPLPLPSPLAGEAADVLFGLPMPMAAAFGLRGTHLDAQRVRVAMPANPAHTNSRGDVHGGAIGVLLDCALASAARSHDPTAFGVATVDMTVHYLAPVRGDMVADATCERRGRSLCFVRGVARDAEGQVVAMATGTFQLVARPATASPTPAAPPTSA